MKSKTRRIIAGSTAVIGTLIAGALVAGLDTVDYRPYFREPYYRDTTARLDVAIRTNTIVHGELEAGFGKVLLTPSLNSTQADGLHGQFKTLALAGYGGRRGRPATGVHDDVYVKAVALRVAGRTGVMVSADALIIPPAITALAIKQLEQNPGLRPEQLYLSATHTHSSLGGWGEGRVAEEFAGTFQPGAAEWFAACIVNAARQAIEDLKPTAFGRGGFAAPDFVKNRLVGPLGRTDPEFSYLVFKQKEGRLAVLGSYAAHATVLSSSTMEFSADYPGAWEQAVEKGTGGVAVFLAGAVGSHSPNSGGRGFEGVERMGQGLARALLDRLPEMKLTNSIVFSALRLEISLPPLNARVSDNLRLRPWLARRLLQHSDQTFIQAFRLDDSIWVSTPCDFSGELALGIKEDVAARGCHAVITSFNGDYIGYVIPSRYYHLDGYEPRTMSFFGPCVPDYFDELIRTMSTGLASK